MKTNTKHLNSNWIQQKGNRLTFTHEKNLEVLIASA